MDVDDLSGFKLVLQSLELGFYVWQVLVMPSVRMDVRTPWAVAEAFANSDASVETAKEAQVNRHTKDRLFRLFRAAIYEAVATLPSGAPQNGENVRPEVPGTLKVPGT